MGQSIIAKGRTIHDAIHIGLDILGATREQVEIEIIQQETKGILRIGSKPAIVKLTKIEQAEKTVPDIEDMIQSIDISEDSKTNNPAKEEHKEVISDDHLEGKVWVHNGKIFCKTSPLYYPTITAGRGIKLYKNNELVNGTIVVTENDTFEIKTEEEVVETKWKIMIDENKLNAILYIEPGMRKTYTIQDIDPSPHIELNGEEHIEVINDLDYEQVLQELQRLDIVHGINHEAILEALNVTKAEKFVIASGISPIQGKDGYIELLIEIDSENKKPMIRTDGTVDFRELNNIPTVNKGQVIAVVHPPVQGTPGITVTNETILPKQTQPIFVQLGQGAAFVENGTKIVATETGRPYFEQNGLLVKVSIVPKLIHSGDVNITTGNIRFKGDVEILGSVEDSMNVQADGNVSVLKNVNKANITAKQSVYIGQNAIGSTIISGNHNIFVSEAAHLLMQIQMQMEKFILSIKQVMNASAFKVTDFHKKGLLPLFKLLLDHKFRTLLTTIKQYIEMCKRGNNLLDAKWAKLGENLHSCFLSSVPNEWHSLERLNQLLNDIKELLVEHSIPNEKYCSIELMYALNSVIYCSGDVTIYGKGCHHSKIHAGGVLKVNGIVRGGELYARLGAIIKEAGSEGGAPTRISVPADQKIRIDLVREGTIIQIGKIRYTFQKEERWIEAFLDEQDRIIFR
ncbi:hypothetical protein B0I26_110120 [Anoxybacillus vitaminiphilus]|uniref:RNA-binding protein KhpB N-terminal domain-containing protein n=1 Tax=Paranoxybacillus vitaminiphilus TaxID=581036 RepID=A0A327YBI5_9BACL|nr:flagellar assembly protein A [Anoxybacillus vitaminiphilus]RAK18488.1 hypothetical protein B0I26_110120 [Anoxybacillus vitaminiphilus]